MVCFKKIRNTAGTYSPHAATSFFSDACSRARVLDRPSAYSWYSSNGGQAAYCARAAQSTDARGHSTSAALSSAGYVLPAAPGRPGDALRHLRTPRCALCHVRSSGHRSVCGCRLSCAAAAQMHGFEYPYGGVGGTRRARQTRCRVLPSDTA
ncbi:hypothetical protein HYPSUDRAFT_895964 [Hypholoma sublateritium FD-334 SS-4]|uniref:Uncharacterized protein n=1 Tax=Hypholoma sublateritium (strain FD-334 SS-4) TaxID=945553 RepID=A0A0D2PGX1_HYPSF|nr:hypothetical protein HYPSUDRAFT_895964 [Hypholoma sublateritium FD-334 SS-4]